MQEKNKSEALENTGGILKHATALCSSVIWFFNWL
jgi:hypothetical protein